MKKIFFICCFYFSILELKAQQYITVQFASSNNVPTAQYNSANNTFTFSSTDTISKIFNKYAISIFSKKYPTAYLENHPKAAKLDRTYILTSSTNIKSLFGELVALGSANISMFYLDSVRTDASLVIPNDYSGNPVTLNACNPVLNLTSSASLDLINAPSAWDVTQGNFNITIGIIDVGFSSTHEDLVNKVLPSNPSPTIPLNNPEGPHGTRVASIAACETNNNKGNSSIGNQSSLKFFDYYGSVITDANGTQINISSIYQLMLIAAKPPNSCKIINLSLRMGCDFHIDEQEAIDMIHDLYNTVIVASAGNGIARGCPDPIKGDVNGLVYPASYNHVISVTGVNCQFDGKPIYDVISSCQFFSTDLNPNNSPATTIFTLCPNLSRIGIGWKDYFDRYPNSRSVCPALLPYTFTNNDRVDVSAPGWYVGYANASLSVPNSYSIGNGTSFASPIVAGTAALMLAVNPNLTPEDIKAILKCTSRDLYEIWENTYYLNKLGTGRIDAGKAVQLAQTWTPNSVITQQAAPTDIRWFEILSNGVNTIEVESNCANNSNPGYCNIGYRLEVVGSSPSLTYKWLSFYAENDVSTINNIRYGNSIYLSRGVDYPFVDNPIGKLKICVRVNECVPSIYYSEEKAASCFGAACSYNCPADITITGNYNTALTESYTWVKSSGQTTIASGSNVKLDASPSQGFIEFKPTSGLDYMVAAPTSAGQFVVQAYNGCNQGSPSFANNNPKAVSDEQVVAIANANNELYPNPTKGIFYVSCNSEIKSLQVYNAQAILVLEKEVNKIEKNTLPIIFDLSKQPAGVYMIKSKDGKFSKKVIKL